MGRILTEKDIEAAVRGGSVYAAGGGGWADHGRMLGGAAVRLGKPELVSVDELAPDAIVATAAAIGAPAGTTAWEMQGVDYIKAADCSPRRSASRSPVSWSARTADRRRSTAGCRRRARRESRRRRRRHPRPPDRRHGLDRPGRLARTDDTDRGRRQPRRAPLHRTRRTRRDRQRCRRSCARPPTVGRLHRQLPRAGLRGLCQDARRARRHFARA